MSSKNLTAGEKLAMTMELQKEIALENKKKNRRQFLNRIGIVIPIHSNWSAMKMNLNLEAIHRQIHKQPKKQVLV